MFLFSSNSGNSYTYRSNHPITEGVTVLVHCVDGQAAYACADAENREHWPAPPQAPLRSIQCANSQQSLDLQKVIQMYHVKLSLSW